MTSQKLPIKYLKTDKIGTFLSVTVATSKLEILRDLASVIKTKKNAIWTNQKSVLLLNEWSRITAKAMTTARKL